MSTISSDTHVAALAEESGEFVDHIAKCFASLASGAGCIPTADRAEEIAADLNSVAQYLRLIAARERGEADASERIAAIKIAA